MAISDDSHTFDSCHRAEGKFRPIGDFRTEREMLVCFVTVDAEHGTALNSSQSALSKLEGLPYQKPPMIRFLPNLDYFKLKILELALVYDVS